MTGPTTTDHDRAAPTASGPGRVRWVDVAGYKVFRALPGPIIGLLFAAAALAVHLLLSGGPRANIYFQF